jgi:SNF2 family DNA or RNA helicase
MGLGKTLQTLTWLQLPRCSADARRVPALIVCPTSLVENWRREALKFVPWMRCLVLSGPERFAKFAQVPESDLVITSYALIRRDTAFHEKCAYSAVVLDEAQAIKNQRTQNAQAVKLLKSETRLVLSGTPIENGVSDLWSIMDFLMPKYLGKYEEFKLRYEDAVELGGRSAEAAQDQLRKKLHPFLLRRVKKDVAPDLPDKIRTVMYCELTPAQRKAYDRIREQVKTRMRNLVKEKGFEKSRFEVLADLMRLRQICCDVSLLSDNEEQPEAESSAKLDTLMELLAEARSGGHRMLVFSQFTSMLKRIAERLEREGVRFCYLDGSTKNRLDECARFNQDTGIPIFLISLKAGGTGLNLTGADMVVHFDPWWNPAAEEQATDRAHRIGQKRTVQAIKLIAQDTIEEKVLEMQRKKQALIDATVNATDGSIVSTLTMAEIEDLLS